MLQRPSENGAQTAARQFVEWGMSHAFCVPGADISVFVQALEDEPKVRAIFATHEFSAGAMADGFSRVSGNIGLAVSIGGPGASYLAAAASAAARDGASVLFVTGMPPGPMASLDGWPDDTASFRAAGAISVDLSETEGFGAAVEELSNALGSGRIAHLRLPLDNQIAPPDTIARESRVWPLDARCTTPPEAAHFSGRTALAIGAGALEHATAIRELSTSCGLPIVTNMLARGVIPENAQLALGHLGFMPHPRAVAATTRRHQLAADLVIALAPEGTFEPTVRAGGVTVQTVERYALSEWLTAAGALAQGSFEERTAWISQLARLSRASIAAPNDDAALGHNCLLVDVAAALGPSAIHVIDAGHFHLLAPVSIVASRPRTILTGSELVSMGWAIGAAIGAKCASPNSPVVAYVGDGSFLMHGLELTTAARYKIPVLFIVGRNGVYGTVRRRTGLAHQAGILGPASPARIAEGCGVEAREVRDREELRQAVNGAKNLDRPRVIVAHLPEIDEAAQGLATGLAWLDGEE